jgi:tRNA dimethylallyltransferase
MQKALIISGPTASGKTDLAYAISQNIPAVLLNADSRQIYKSLDIIAGKDLPKDSRFILDHRFEKKFPWNIGYYEINSTPMYLLDLVEPSNSFSVHDYQRVVRTILPTITNKRVPIFVGGSNFYISSLINSIETLAIPPDITLRNKLTQYTVIQLRNFLYEIDGSRLHSMNDSDGQNPRRLIRAIEVSQWMQKNNNKNSTEKAVLESFNVLHIGLTAPLDYLRKKIDARVDARIVQGAMQEAEAVYKDWDTLSSNVKTANGYAQLFNYFAGDISHEEAVQRWKYSEYHNAKKQLTWIHGDSKIKKYSIIDPHFSDSVLHDVLSFLSSQ